MLSKKFVCAGYDYSTYTDFVPAPYFRKSFYVECLPTDCRVTVCGLGFYDIFINGTKITKGLLAPYISNPDDIIYYDEYDLSEYLAEGENVLGFQLGNGMQNSPGGQIWDFDIAAFRGAPRLAFALELDGETIEADDSVKTAASPIVFDDLRCGCFYDARNESDGWAEPGFDDSAWKSALRAETPRGEARICEAEPILPRETLKPVSVRRCTLAHYEARGDVVKDSKPFCSKEKEGWLYDFGVNTAGIETLRIKGERGQQIDLQFAEYINPDGELDYGNLGFYPDGFVQRDVYILKGEGEEVFDPQFTYHGARYCLVLGLTDEQATEELLTFDIGASAIGDRGDFRCSDDTVNKLQVMTRNSDLSNFYYFPTDCPHREKNGWTGDAAVSCEQLSLNFAPEKSYKEWLRNIRKTQKETGELPGIIPTGGWGYEWGNGPAWDQVATVLPYMTYLLRGDREILEENSPTIMRYAEYISRNRTARGTVELGLGDWCPVTKFKSPLEFTDSVVCMDILDKAAYIFSVLGQPLQENFCVKLRREIRSAVREHLVDLSTCTAIGCCQTSQAMAIYYNVFDPGEKAQAFKVLLKIISDSDDHMDCGILGARCLFRVLADHGKAELAYELITRPDYPSYGNFVTRGLTALPEDFLREGQRPNSLNHHFFGDISAWFIEYIAGIRVNPAGNDCREVRVTPNFIARLDFAEGHYDTVGGRVAVRWERDGSDIALTVECADRVHGEIRLPNGCRFKQSQLSFAELESGRYEIVY